MRREALIIYSGSEELRQAEVERIQDFLQGNEGGVWEHYENYLFLCKFAKAINYHCHKGHQEKLYRDDKFPPQGYKRGIETTLKNKTFDLPQQNV